MIASGLQSFSRFPRRLPFCPYITVRPLLRAPPRPLESTRNGACFRQTPEWHELVLADLADLLLEDSIHASLLTLSGSTSAALVN